MTSYFAVTPDEGTRLLQAVNTDRVVGIENIRQRRGSGEMIDEEVLAALRSELDGIREQYPEVLGPKDQSGGRFEQEACVPVHQRLAELPREILADPDFWTWLAIAHFSELIEWRFGSTGRSAALNNYGCEQSKRGENLMYRLWLRGEVGLDQNLSDPYLLARTGDQDLWRSHIVR